MKSKPSAEFIVARVSYVYYIVKLFFPFSFLIFDDEDLFAIFNDVSVDNFRF